jgi:hypothetical protein
LFPYEKTLVALLSKVFDFIFKMKPILNRELSETPVYVSIVVVKKFCLTPVFLTPLSSNFV